MPKVIDLLGIPLPSDTPVGLRIVCGAIYPPGMGAGRPEIISTVINVNGDVDIANALAIGRGILADELRVSTGPSAPADIGTCGIAALWPGPLQGGHDIP